MSSELVSQNHGLISPSKAGTQSRILKFDFQGAALFFVTVHELRQAEKTKIPVFPANGQALARSAASRRAFMSSIEFHAADRATAVPISSTSVATAVHGSRRCVGVSVSYGKMAADVFGRICYRSRRDQRDAIIRELRRTPKPTKTGRPRRRRQGGQPGHT